jgi:flagellar hook-basal body complex protein FliE
MRLNSLTNDFMNQIAPEPISPNLPSTIGGGQSGEKTFGQFLTQALGEVNDTQLQASSTMEQFATGAPMDVHQVMIAMEQASTSLALTVQVRNKIISAYEEIMKTQV